MHAMHAPATLPMCCVGKLGFEPGDCTSLPNKRRDKSTTGCKHSACNQDDSLSCVAMATVDVKAGMHVLLLVGPMSSFKHAPATFCSPQANGTRFGVFSKKPGKESNLYSKPCKPKPRVQAENPGNKLIENAAKKC